MPVCSHDSKLDSLEVNAQTFITDFPLVYFLSLDFPHFWLFVVLFKKKNFYLHTACRNIFSLKTVVIVQLVKFYCFGVIFL